MNRREYETRLAVLLEQAHNLTSGIHALMSAIGDDPGTAEWHRLYDLSRLAGSTADMLDKEKHPGTRPSAIEDDHVAMVCTVCRTPVHSLPPENIGPGVTWAHDSDADADSCPRLMGTPVKAMVAAGSERVPLDLAKPALSVRLDG